LIPSLKGTRKRNATDSYLFNMAIDPSPNGIYNGRSSPGDIIQNPFPQRNIPDLDPRPRFHEDKLSRE